MKLNDNNEGEDLRERLLKKVVDEKEMTVEKISKMFKNR